VPHLVLIISTTTITTIIKNDVNPIYYYTIIITTKKNFNNLSLVYVKIEFSFYCIVFYSFFSCFFVYNLLQFRMFVVSDDVIQSSQYRSTLS